MRLGAAVILWLAVGVVVWNGFYDLYVSRGAREYLQMAAEAELGRRETPSMSAVMAAAQQNGAKSATYWALLVVGSGWATVFLAWQSAGARRVR